MTTSIDSLIESARNAASSARSNAQFTAEELREFALEYARTSINLTGIKSLNLTGNEFPVYTEPADDTTSLPVYEPPTATLPNTPVLNEVANITIPADRAEPTVNITGLFEQTPPSSNLPDFNEAEPDLRIDDLVAEMDAIATPVLQDLDLPTLSPFTIRDTPTIDVPTFDAVNAPDTLADPEDYAARMEASYQQMAPEMQAFIDDKVSTWIGNYAPEYTEWTTTLQAKITDGMANTVLPDAIESAMFTRARDRASAEFDAAIYTDADNFAKSGLMQPPGLLVSREHDSRMKKAAALANQATDVYIERRKMEVQHLQFVLGLASSQITSVRNLAVSYAGVVGSTLQQATAYASTLAEKVAKMYDHLIARAQIAVTVMNALNEQYKIKLQAALSEMEGFRLELEAEKAKKDVELAQVQFVEAQIRVQELAISRYSALIDAVSKKSTMEELKLKGYEIRADIFKNNTSARLATFDMYKAALEGDRYKLDGEKSKLEIFNSLIKADELKLEAQIKQAEAIGAINEVRLQTFKSGSDVYKLDAEVALQKYAAQAEIKKLAQTVHAQELQNAIESFKANLELPKILMDAMIKEYELQVRTAIEEAKLSIEQMQLVERAMESVANNFGNIAQSATGAMSTMVSQAIDAAA